MTATLAMELDAGPLERVRTELACVTYFAGERPLRRSAGRADWRLCGRLSSLLAAGRLTGAEGEAVLVTTRGGLRAPLLVALGLGAPAAFDAAGLEAAAEELGRRGLGLRVSRLALSLSESEYAAIPLRARVEALVGGFARVLAERDAELCLGLVAPEPEHAGVREALRAVRPQELRHAVALRLPAAPGPRRVSRNDRARAPSPAIK